MKFAKLKDFFKLPIWPIVFVLIFLAIVFLPDVWGMANTPAGYQYNYRDGDLGVYFNYMNQARDGHFLFCNQFTSEAQNCVLFFPLWWLGGQIGTLTGLSNQLISVILRLVMAAVLAFFSYWFLKKIFIKTYQWIWPLFLISGGVYVSYFHSNVFLTSLFNALNCLVYLLYLILLYYWWKFSQTKNSWRSWSIIAGLSLVLVAIHPYELLYLWLSVGWFLLLLLVWRPTSLKSGWFYSSALIAGTILPALYYLIIFLGNPALGGWAGNNYLPVYTYLGVFLNFGLLIILAVLGVHQLRVGKAMNPKPLTSFGFRAGRSEATGSWWYFIVGMGLAGLTAVFLPLYVSNKLFLAWYLPLFFLSALALERFFLKPNKLGLKISIGVLVFVLLVFGNLKVIGLRLWQSQYPVYLQNSYYEPWQWLAALDHSQPVVLAHYGWNTFIGAYCHCRVFIGGNQTNNLDLKQKLIDWFYADNGDDVRKQEFLKVYGINYVFWSKLEQKTGDFLPDTKHYLQKVYSNDLGQLYKVN